MGREPYFAYLAINTSVFFLSFRQDTFCLTPTFRHLLVKIHQLKIYYLTNIDFVRRPEEVKPDVGGKYHVLGIYKEVQ